MSGASELARSFIQKATNSLYIKGTDGEGATTELTENFNPITWWSTASYPSMRQWAFDTLSCPATSCKCERVFSSAKKLITLERNSHADNTIEALECLRTWFDKGFIKREENVY
jgi:hAT family C-terminal dimerisation region